MVVVIEEMTHVLWHFEVDLHLQKSETKERVDQLEIVFVTTFENFEQLVQEEISGCKGKETLMLLNWEIWQLKSENNKLNPHMHELFL